ncbi:MAG TPA: hypothetical protein VKR22_15570 [Acidimicrobiales bacterium]|nr:hypothetical protein [Acidimicrobiales bacterium]
MPRDTTVRTRIIEYLASNGSVDDRSGRATSRLKEAVGYAGGDAGFIRIVSLMAESGDIERVVKGKRTYRISVPPGTPIPASVVRSDETGSASLGAQIADGALDYDELASSLLARVAQVLSGSEARGAGGDQATWARRRIDQLEARLASLQRDVARARAETEGVKQERDELRSQLDAASHNIELLTERIGSNQARNTSRAADRLGSEEQALLYRLREPGRSKPTRVG